VNSDDSLADIQIFSKENEIISLDFSKLDHVELVWEKYEVPFTGNKLIIVHRKKSKEIVFKIIADSAKGILYLNDKKYNIVCDWRR